MIEVGYYDRDGKLLRKVRAETPPPPLPTFPEIRLPPDDLPGADVAFIAVVVEGKCLVSGVRTFAALAERP